MKKITCRVRVRESFIIRALPCRWEQSRWDLGRDGVTSSLLSMFRTCREQCKATFVDGWKPEHVPDGMWFGKIGHWILERLYGRKTKPTRQHVADACVSYAHAWAKQHPKPTERQRDTLARLVQTCRAVYDGYISRYATDWSHKWARGFQGVRIAELIGVEKAFSVPFTYTDGVTVPIRGHVDMPFVDPKKRAFILDTKHYSMINVDDLTDTLPVNLQTNLYAWAVSKWIDRPVSGAVLNIVRRPGMRVNKTEKLVDYVRRCAVDIDSRPDHYFVRVPVTFTRSEISRWHDDVLVPLMNDVRAWYTGKSPHYMNDGALIGRYGRCGLFALVVNGDSCGCVRVKRPLDYHEDV